MKLEDGDTPSKMDWTDAEARSQTSSEDVSAVLLDNGMVIGIVPASFHVYMAGKMPFVTFDTLAIGSPSSTQVTRVEVPMPSVSGVCYYVETKVTDE